MEPETIRRALLARADEVRAGLRERWSTPRIADRAIPAARHCPLFVDTVPSAGMASVVIAGGGLAGLVAARHLAERGVDVTLFERRGEVGGRVRTVREDGFVFDRGFQVLFTAYPSARRELDYDALRLRRFKPGAVIARPGDRSVLSDPLRDPGALADTLFNPDVRFGDTLRLFRLRRELARRDERQVFSSADATTGSYLADRGFSEAFVRNFAAPFYGGITLDRSLSTASGVFEYTFKMLNEGYAAVPADGMGAIPEQLADVAHTAGAKLVLGREVEAVEPTGDGAALDVGGETIDADAAVVATDPKAARRLTGIASIPTEARGCVTQYYSLPEHSALNTGKKIVLNAEDPTPNQVVPLSAVAPEYAPDGVQLLSATFLGQPDASDADLAEHTRGALSSWYPERHFGELDHLRTERVAFAQFAQPPGCHAALPAVDAPEGRVYLAGDYTRWSSIHGALSSGRAAAEAVLADL